jgi:hypothetical protein
VASASDEYQQCYPAVIPSEARDLLFSKTYHGHSRLCPYEATPEGRGTASLGFQQGKADG